MRLKTQDDIKKLAESGRILSNVLKELKRMAKEGVRLSFLDDEAGRMLKEADAISAFFGYQPEGAREPFPANICTSVNEIAVHGVPNDYELKSGDVLKIDLGVNLGGYITDSATTVGIGSISDEAHRLMVTTRRALEQGIKECRVGNKSGDIGYVIQGIVEEAGFKVLKSLTGHGVGFDLHEDLTVYNFGDRDTGFELKEGIVLAIEPITAVSSESIRQGKNESFKTGDGSVSAQFEATVAVSRKPIILTPIV